MFCMLMVALTISASEGQQCASAGGNPTIHDTSGNLTYIEVFKAKEFCHWYFNHSSENFAFKITFHYLLMQNENPRCDYSEPFMVLPDFKFYCGKVAGTPTYPSKCVIFVSSSNNASCQSVIRTNSVCSLLEPSSTTGLSPASSDNFPNRNVNPYAISYVEKNAPTSAYGFSLTYEWIECKKFSTASLATSFPKAEAVFTHDPSTSTIKLSTASLTTSFPKTRGVFTNDPSAPTITTTDSSISNNGSVMTVCPCSSGPPGQENNQYYILLALVFGFAVIIVIMTIVLVVLKRRLDKQMKSNQKRVRTVRNNDTIFEGKELKESHQYEKVENDVVTLEETAGYDSPRQLAGSNYEPTYVGAQRSANTVMNKESTNQGNKLKKRHQYEKVKDIGTLEETVGYDMPRQTTGSNYEPTYVGTTVESAYDN